MNEFVAGLTKEARKELLDYLHECRHTCRRARRDELFENLSKLVAMLEKAAPRERTESGFVKVVKSGREPDSALAGPTEPKRPTVAKKAPPND